MPPSFLKSKQRVQGSAGGVFSAFQFMATPASATDDAAPPPPPPSGNASAPSALLSALGVPMTGGDGDEAPGSGGGRGVEMSAFSFLADDSRRQSEGAPLGGDEEGGGSDSEGIPEDPATHAPAPSLSSFSFLSEGGGGGGAPAAAGVATPDKGGTREKAPSVAGAALPPPSSSDGNNSGSADRQSAATGDSGGGGSGGRVQTPNVASGASSPSSSAPTGAANAGVAAEEGAGRKVGTGAGAGTGAGTAVPSWKPSSTVVRKKRTARRVGYARDESLSSSSSGAAAAASSPLTVPSATTAEHSPLGSPPPPVVATAGGAGISYVPEGGSNYAAPAVRAPGKESAGARRGGGEGVAMDDSQVAEAAAMAALAASMAPGEIQGARSKGDLKQVELCSVPSVVVCLFFSLSLAGEGSPSLHPIAHRHVGAIRLLV